MMTATFTRLANLKTAGSQQLIQVFKTNSFGILFDTMA
jgi:hypothetical protein